MFFIRFFNNLLLLLLINIPLEILGWIILLPVCFLSKKDKLPVILRWFDNADLYIDRDTSTYLNVIKSGWFNRYCWLAFRNPCNYFGYKILGFKSNFSIPRSPVGDSAGYVPGLFYIEHSGYYEYYYIKKWSATKCFRFRMGWKLSNTDAGDWVQRVFVIQPYKSYTGV